MKIGVIGAGWLGKAFVDEFQSESEHEIYFTNRKKDESNAQSIAFEFGDALPEQLTDNLDFLFITSTLPRTEEALVHSFVEQLSSHLSPSCKVIFTSTIGVYQDVEGEVDETTTLLKSDSIYTKMEQYLLEAFQERTILLRLGGLIGEDRHPITSLAGRTQVAGGQKAVNLIHRADILNFFSIILNGAVSGGIYNLVYPHHPQKSVYYQSEAEKRQLEVPTFDHGKGRGKIVEVSKSQAVKDFAYQHAI